MYRFIGSILFLFKLRIYNILVLLAPQHHLHKKHISGIVFNRSVADYPHEKLYLVESIGMEKHFDTYVSSFCWKKQYKFAKRKKKCLWQKGNSPDTDMDNYGVYEMNLVKNSDNHGTALQSSVLSCENLRRQSAFQKRLWVLKKYNCRLHSTMWSFWINIWCTTFAICAKEFPLFHTTMTPELFFSSPLASFFASAFGRFLLASWCYIHFLDSAERALDVFRAMVGITSIGKLFCFGFWTFLASFLVSHPLPWLRGAGFGCFQGDDRHYVQ